MTVKLETMDKLQNLASIDVSEIMSKEILKAYEGWSIRKLSQFFET